MLPVDVTFVAIHLHSHCSHGHINNVFNEFCHF